MLLKSSKHSNTNESFRNHMIIQPVWYRGYFDKMDKSAQIKKLLKYYKAKKIVVGHTIVEHIRMIQREYVIAIGTHYGQLGKIAEGLLIENNHFFALDENGGNVELE